MYNDYRNIECSMQRMRTLVNEQNYRSRTGIPLTVCMFGLNLQLERNQMDLKYIIQGLKEIWCHL